jgi:RND family efflux transporter MFP subunit
MPAEKAKLDDLKIDRSPEREGGSRGWIWLLVLVLPALAVAAWWWLQPAAPARVGTARAREARGGGQETVLNASGYVTARRQATVSSKITGKVVEVFIEEGMEVEEGRILARLDDTNVGAGLRLAEAELKASRTGIRETEVLLEDAGRDLRRARNLVSGGVASQKDLDDALAEFDALEARLERQRDDVRVAESQVALWQQQVEDTVIRAPFDGIIVAKNAQPGEMISPISAGGGFTRTGIGTVVDMSSLEIEVDVNESYINRVQAGQKVVATLDAYPEWPIPCHVIAIIPTADRQRATVQVRVGFEELDPRILPDMGVKVAFQEVGTAEDVPAGILVPEAAVRRTNGRDVVLVVEDGRIETRAVTVGEARGDDVRIAAGLAAGEAVVIDGPAGLVDGDRVEERSR